MRMTLSTCHTPQAASMVGSGKEFKEECINHFRFCLNLNRKYQKHVSTHIRCLYIIIIIYYRIDSSKSGYTIFCKRTMFSS